MRIRLVALACVLLVAACGGNGSQDTATTGQDHAITGTLRITGKVDEEITTFDNGECWGTGGFEDIRDNVQVTVTNEQATVIGTGKLERSQYTKDEDQIPELGEFGSCEFHFVIANVPTAKFYKFTVSHRGEFSISYDELRARGWRMHLIVK